MRKVLNLSEGFNPEDASPEELIAFKEMTFNGGEPHIKIENLTIEEYPDGVELTITHRVTSFNELGMLMVAVDAANRTGAVNGLRLVLPYFPGARQDRIMVEGEPLTCKLYANMINSMGFDEVVIFDPHSDVVPALLECATVINNHEFVQDALTRITWEKEAVTYVVSPDAGANKKVIALTKHLEEYGLIKCDKTRNVATGKITGFEVYAEDLGGAACVIVDDICDGGGTFIGLAEALKAKNAGKLYLIVSHGIFSKGFRELNKHFELIYTTDSFPNIDEHEFAMRWENQSHRLRQIKLRDVLQ